MINDTSTVLDYLSTVSIGGFTGKLIYFLGGLAGATIIFFIVSVYISYRNHQMLKEILLNNQLALKEIIRLRKKKNGLLRRR